MWPPRNELGPWSKFALCRGQDRDIWFPMPGESNRPAKEICVNCPVKRDCLEYALARPHICGVWGGCSERERELMRRARRAS